MLNSMRGCRVALCLGWNLAGRWEAEANSVFGISIRHVSSLSIMCSDSLLDSGETQPCQGLVFERRPQHLSYSMGSSSSKAARQLPKAPPAWAGARRAPDFKYPDGVLPLGADKVQPPSRGPSGDATKSPRGAPDYKVIQPSGAGTGNYTGRKNSDSHASEVKDDSEYLERFVVVRCSTQS